MGFAEDVLTAFKDASGTTEQLKQKLAPFYAEIYSSNKLLEFPYEYNTSTPLLLRNVVMAQVVLLLNRMQDATFAHFHDLVPFFTEINPSAEARLFALLYFLKPRNAQVSFSDLGDLLDLELVESGNVGEVSLEDLTPWASRLLSHPRGLHVLNEIVSFTKDEDDENPVEIDFDKLVKRGVHFFTCPDKYLYGFSTIDAIFINVNTLQDANKTMRKLTAGENVAKLGWTENDQKYAKITKMMTAMIGFHELAHLAVRKATNNAALVDTNFLKPKFGYFHSFDAGVVAQIRFLDLPLLSWSAISVFPPTVEALFKFFETATSVAPPSVTPVHLSMITPEIRNGIYKIPSPVPFY